MRPKTDTNGGAVTLPRPSGCGAAFPPEGIPGWETVFHARLDSTNLEAKRLVAQGFNGKRLIVAETQTNGQCRHDRLWESAAGKGIWASFILPVSVPPEVLPQSSLVLAVAVREGIRRATGVELKTKWPNDLLGEGRKCCGLLVETICAGNTATPLILGAGINCNQLRDDFPPYLREVATSLAMLSGNAPLCRESVLAGMAGQIDHWFGLWETRGFQAVREAWLDHTCTVGKTVLLPEGYGCSQGIAEDMDQTGALVVLSPDGTRLRINSGEVLFAPRGRDTTVYSF